MGATSPRGESLPLQFQEGPRIHKNPISGCGNLEPDGLSILPVSGLTQYPEEVNVNLRCRKFSGSENLS